MEDRLEIAENI